MRARGHAGRCAARVTYTLPQADTSARWARYMTAAYLSGDCCRHVSAEQVDDARLIVSELVTNATRHGRGSCLLRLSVRAGHVTVEVHDNGPAVPGLSPSAPAPGPCPQVETLPEHGRGIAMVRELSSSLCVLGDRAHGKTVQAVLAG